MRVHLCVVGRLRAGPERDLVDDYLTRFDRTGRTLGLGPSRVVELEGKKVGRQVAETELLLKAIPDGAAIWALDERGRMLGSPDFATRMAGLRDQGRGDLAFVIGGADGLTQAFRDRADKTISFGPMVWPHMLARVMLAEQLYRAAAILSGSPYHRV